MASRLHEILRKDVFSDIETGPRMSAFWEYLPPAAPSLPILLIHTRSQVKTRQSHKFKNIAKNSNFGILQQTLHAPHLLKLLDKNRCINMKCFQWVSLKIQSGYDSIHRQMDKGTWNRYTSAFNFVEAGGIIRLQDYKHPNGTASYQAVGHLLWCVCDEKCPLLFYVLAEGHNHKIL